MSMVNLEYIRSRRAALGLSQQFVANALGFKNASTYLKYENGTYVFKAKMLPKLAELFEVEIDKFFCETDC